MEEGDPRVSDQAPPDPITHADSFGGNEWLIEELFAKYRKDKSLVDPAWQDFFAAYERDGADNGT
ncbi:MAG TPA: hypothetical protein VK095_14975, partial [Beutenbergiaceae bacterium]|nr:hypothetical protein [Beutenbergiaceae bacterium]